ncbi:MAG: Uncharacterized protein G01um1014106_8 [Parcubacteria group bacterium Gr01-1014_106]|nr:MAG: Uncharacterized protein G01um1014106_8 [Parcubacteria group bacterium Gr01-1014_106]
MVHHDNPMTHTEHEPLMTIGETSFRGAKRRIVLAPEDRLHHTYLVGKTGTGKTTVLQQMVLQDIRAGHGCCFVDPHGDAIAWLLRQIPPERFEDVVLFNPADQDYPLGLNLLEASSEEEKDFLVSEAIEMFYKLFDPNREGLIGPQFEHWMRNAALTLMADPEGGTLLEIPRLFTDHDFELQKRRHVRDAVVQAFWEQQMARTSEFHRSEMLNYFTSKFGRFMTNTLMRNILGQQESAFRWADALQGRKIVLINLSKGQIGELNAMMLGLILMTKLAVAVLQRAHLPPEERTPFYLYVDEFQNVLTDAFISLLAEARKYGLGVHLAHQYLGQISDEIRQAVLGNARTILAFQVSAADASILLREFDPDTERAGLDAETLQFLPPHHFVIKLTLHGRTYPAFQGESVRLPEYETPITPEHVIALTRLCYGSPRTLVERAFRARWATTSYAFSATATK